MAPRRPPLALWILPALLLPLACGGADEPAPSARFDLLAREPDALVEQPGQLVPGDPRWAALAGDGWVVPQGGLAWAVSRSVELRLPALSDADLALELELVGPGRGARVEPTLNGIELEPVSAESEPGAHVVRVPASAWRRGDNVLALRGKGVRAVDGQQTYFGLARVAWGETRARIERSAGRVELPSGCGVAYRLELLGASAVRASGHASGAGRLELRARALDPRTGEDAAGLAEVRDTSGGRVDAGLALPSVDGVVELEVAWHAGEPGARLALDALELSERAAAPRPSVLFVSIDTLAAQHLSLHGYARATSPNLEAFARDAVVFTRCRANAPWTIPSYMSQLTGLYPRAHTIDVAPSPREPAPWETQQIAPERWTLAEFFRAAGYRTAAFVDNPWLARGFGFAQGFDEFDASAAGIPLARPEGGVRHVVPRALAWLDARERSRPFFLFAQAFDPHAPYHAAEPWKGRFDGDGLLDEALEAPLGVGQAFAYGCVPDHAARELFPAPLPERVRLAPLATAYDEKIAEVDETLGRLFDGLRERGLYDELVIVVSADHGESTLGHGLYFNHALLHGDVLHVPLLIKLPGRERAGARVDSLVQLVDLYPTLLELVRPGARREVHGESLVPLLRGGAAEGRVAFAEGGMMEQSAVERDGWKLITSFPLRSGAQTRVTHPRVDRARLADLCPELATGFRSNAEIEALLARNPAAADFLRESLEGPVHELYYLPDDPGELRDLAARHPERVAELAAHAQRLAQLAEGARVRGAAAPAELSPSAIDELRDLGYVGE